MADSATTGVLQAIQSNVDDIRNLASCKICLRPFYEPFILSCGHTFCYGCLRNWVCGGESRKKNKSCPECRASIRDQPGPNYALRDLAHMFTDRAELLPADETLDEHKRGKVEEAQLLADDRLGPGLFNNIFKRFHDLEHMPSYIWDPSDGVQRCPLCNWEMEESFCNHCGHDALEDSLDEDLSDDGLDDDDDDSDSLNDESDISIGIPDEISIMDPEEDGTSALRNAYTTTDGSETNTDTDPYPWGNRYSHHPLSHMYDTDEDDDDEEADWEDYSDSMGQFLDDPDPQEDFYRHNPHFSVLASTLPDPFHEASDMSEYSEEGYSMDTESDRTSGSATDDDDDDDTSTINGHYDYDQSHDDDDDDESEGDPATTPVPPPTSRRRGHIVISDEDEEEEDEDGEEDDRFVDAVTGNEPDPEDASVGIANNDRIIHHSDGQASDNGDSDDEDEPIRSAHSIRGRSRPRVVQTARRSGYRGARNQRNSHADAGNSRGYHPYTRPNDASRGGNRYRNHNTEARGRTRTAIVY